VCMCLHYTVYIIIPTHLHFTPATRRREKHRMALGVLYRHSTGGVLNTRAIIILIMNIKLKLGGFFFDNM